MAWLEFSSCPAEHQRNHLLRTYLKTWFDKLTMSGQFFPYAHPEPVEGWSGAGRLVLR